MTIQVGVIMTGSDFINVSMVPSFDVNQHDLGDVFVTPCRSETYSSDHSGICKDCTSCISDEYERLQCMADQDRVCSNCTACNNHEYQICECNLKTQSCYLGNRICAPLSAADINITFELTMGSSLSNIQFHFVENGLSTGFALFLSDYLSHDVSLIEFKGMTNVKGLLFSAMFIIHNVYDKNTITKAENMDRLVIQQALSYTFGVAFTGSRRRMLVLSSPITNISAGVVTTSCVITSACPVFFHLSNSTNSCDNLCVYDPCPMGFTGDFGACSQCPNATFKGTVGNESCTMCPTGYTSAMGSVSSHQCYPMLSLTVGILHSTSPSYYQGPATSSSSAYYQGPDVSSGVEPLHTISAYRVDLRATTTAQVIASTQAPLYITTIPIKIDPVIQSIPTTPPNPAKSDPTSLYSSNPSQSSNNLMGMSVYVQSSMPFIILQDTGYGYLAIVAVVGIMMCGILSLAGTVARLYYATTRRGWFYIPIDMEDEPKKIIPHTIVRLSYPC